MPHKPHDYHQTIRAKQKGSTAYNSFAPTDTERNMIIRLCGAGALCIYELWLRQAGAKHNPDFIDDQKYAEIFGWSVKTQNKYRTRLQQHGFFGYSGNKAKKPSIIYYYFGRVNVQRATTLGYVRKPKEPIQLTPEELAESNKLRGDIA